MYFGHFKGLGVFSSFYRLEGILVIFKVSEGILFFFKEVFWPFLGFGGISIIIKVSRVFGHF